MIYNKIKNYSVCYKFTFLFLTLYIIFRNIPIKQASDIPDPYVKLYVLPKKDNSNTKRKTEVMVNKKQYK